MKVIESILTQNDCYQSNKKITPIGVQLHSIGASQNSASVIVSDWNRGGLEMCVHYICDAEQEGVVHHILPNNVRSWADAGFGNGNLITVEMMESDYMSYHAGSANFTITNDAKFRADIKRSYNTAVKLVAKLCKEHGWRPTDKLSNGLYRVSSHDEGRRLGLSSGHVDPTHIWTIMGWTMDKFRKDVEIEMNLQPKLGTKASDINKLGSEKEKAEKILEIVTPIAKRYDLLPSVAAAQTILESGYCGTDLALAANNVCGMKTTLSGNTWTGSTWDGKSKYTKKTAEQTPAGQVYYVTADFRKYNCIEDSIADRCAYILGAMNGNKLRYEGIQECLNYIDQITLIKNGGYALDVSYIQKIVRIIERFDLDRDDRKVDPVKKELYRVRLTWGTSMETQIGAYENLKKAKEDCKAATKGYKVFDSSGNVVYDSGELTKDAQREIAAKWAIKIANDNSHGYNNEYNHRYGNPDYACSSYVNQAFREAAVAGLRPSQDTYTADMKAIYMAAGFVDVSSKVNLKTGEGTQTGDVLLTNGHVEMVVNDRHDLAGARGNAPTNLPENGAPGDQTGGEIAVIGWWDFNWHTCLRLEDKKIEKHYWVVAGSFDNRDNAFNMKRAITEKGIKATVIKLNNKYLVRCNKYEFKDNAEKKARKVRAVGFDAFVKYVP